MIPSVSSHGDVVLNDHAKQLLYKIHCGQGATAIDSDGKTRPLADCDINSVKYISGMWRVQNPFNYEIQVVRGEEFVLMEKLNRTEKNRFEFYRAQPIGKNCYGRFLVPKTTKIVAKYETDNHTYWSYGNSIEQARAFLGIRLYDEYQDLIHAHACKNKLRQK